MAGSSGAAGSGNPDCCGTVGPATGSFTPSGPVTLTSGQTVSGLHITNPDGPCIVGDGVSNVHVINCKIGPCGPGSQGVGIRLADPAEVSIEHNSFDDVASALYVLGSNSGSGVVFSHNYATKIRGPMPRGQLVQFDKVSGPGHRIVCNVSDQMLGGYGEGPEDHVNMFASKGTVDSPILVRNNRFRGGGSASGGGVMTGDSAGANIVVDSNILVDPGQYGVAVAGGENIKLLNNKVYASKNAWTNVGCYVWSQNAAPCTGHEVRGNRVNYTNKDGTQNPFWDGGNCGTIAGVSDNGFPDVSITEAIWQEPFTSCP